MTNWKAKGKKIEDRLRRHYEAQGWVCHQAVSTGTNRGGMYISHSNDIYNCIDLMMKHPDHTYTMWLQATTRAGTSARIKKIKESGVPWNENDKVAVVGYWGRSDKKPEDKSEFFQYRWMHEDYKIVHDDAHRLYTVDMEE